MTDKEIFRQPPVLTPEEMTRVRDKHYYQTGEVLGASLENAVAKAQRDDTVVKRDEQWIDWIIKVLSDKRHGGDASVVNPSESGGDTRQIGHNGK